MAGKFKSLKGKLLLDAGNLQGSFFQRTVVLVCEHDAEGAFGLVLNRTVGSRVGDLIEGDLPVRLKELPLFLGGPVQPSALSFLHSAPTLLTANVLPQVQVGHSLDDLVDIAGSFPPSGRLRVFGGYSGWSPGQLDDEMRRDAWMLHPATADLIFQEPPDQLWRQILRGKGLDYRLLAESPEDPSLN
jgi:putative transcriptional regulator